jgi:hypothetical protein
MLDLNRIAEVAEEVARETFGQKQVKDIRVSHMSEWTGEDALDVVVVMPKSAGPQLRDGEKLSAMLLNLGDRLYDLGELRFAHVRYTTRKEPNTRGCSGPSASA